MFIYWFTSTTDLFIYLCMYIYSRQLVMTTRMVQIVVGVVDTVVTTRHVMFKVLLLYRHLFHFSRLYNRLISTSTYIHYTSVLSNQQHTHYGTRLFEHYMPRRYDSVHNSYHNLDHTCSHHKLS
jgi:hypothetical protein